VRGGLAGGRDAERVLVALERDGHILGFDLHAVADAAEVLGGDQRCARAEEGVVYVALVVADGAAHALQRLLGQMTARNVLIQRDMPDRARVRIADPAARLALADAIPAGLVLVGIVPAADREVRLAPHQLVSDLEACRLERGPREDHVVAGRRPRVSNHARKQRPRLGPVGPVVIGDLPAAAAIRM